MNFFGTEIDTSSMTLDELKEIRDGLQEIIDNLDSQIAYRQLYTYRHSTYPFYS